MWISDHYCCFLDSWRHADWASRVHRRRASWWSWARRRRAVSPTCTCSGSYTLISPPGIACIMNFQTVTKRRLLLNYRTLGRVLPFKIPCIIFNTCLLIYFVFLSLNFMILCSDWTRSWDWKWLTMVYRGTCSQTTITVSETTRTDRSSGWRLNHCFTTSTPQLQMW